jgi:hypothetical protein
MLSFSSFKELADSKVNFDLKNTPLINGKTKQTIFLELLNKETSFTNKKP